MMFMHLGSFLTVFSVVSTLLMVGCTSAPATVSGAPAASAKAGGATLFSERVVDESQDEDFWDTGATASVDDNGRLLYVVPTDIVADGSLNDQERLSYQGARSTYVYLDPITGVPVMAPSGPWPGGSRGVTNGSTIGTRSDTRISTPMSLPRPSPRTAPSGGRSGPTRSDRR